MSFSACFVQLQILNQGPVIRRAANKHISSRPCAPGLRPAPPRCVLEFPRGGFPPRFYQETLENIYSLEKKTLTPDQFITIIEAGIFEGQPLELINGRLTYMQVESFKHAQKTMRLRKILAEQLGNRVEFLESRPLKLQNGVVLPDLALVTQNYYEKNQEHPTAADVFLVVEVAKSTLSNDITKKLAMYEESGILEYWVIDIESSPWNLKIFKSLQGNCYTYKGSFTGGLISPIAFPKCIVDLDQLFNNLN